LLLIFTLPGSSKLLNLPESVLSIHRTTDESVEYLNFFIGILMDSLALLTSLIDTA
jgi:hypothetical protein